MIFIIYITGDTHADFHRFTTENFPEQKNLTKDDYVIICGDFGGVFNYIDSGDEERYWLDWMNDKPFTTLFVDGNHENHTRLRDWRRIDYHGGKAHRIRDSIYHLMRGYVFEFDGKSFFTFGGAKSHDIQDGILRLENYKSLSDMIKDYKMRTIWLGQMIRMNEISWWKDEQPSAYEMQRGIDNLKKVDFKVDYVITHTCPQRICEIMSDRFKPEKLSLYFDKLIDMGLQFEGWHYGHFHKDVTFDNKYHLHYRKIEKL